MVSVSIKLPLCVAVAIAAFISIDSDAQSNGPMVRDHGAEKISEHVYVIKDGGVPGVPNVGIVVGSKAALVIDTGLGKRNGEIVLREAKRIAPKLMLYLVTTHVHPEHDLGAHAFPASTKMIRSRDQVNEIEEFGQATADAFRKRSPVMKELLDGAEFRKADITFDKEHTINLGGVRVKVIAMGPNHTPGDTAIWIERDAVLFAGDIAMKALPAFASPKSSLDHWLESLDRLAALHASIVVPSHGPLGDEAFIATYREYLTAVRTKTAASKANGKTLEDATQAVSAELKDRYADTSRMSGAIRVAYAEAK